MLSIKTQNRLNPPIRPFPSFDYADSGFVHAGRHGATEIESPETEKNDETARHDENCKALDDFLGLDSAPKITLVSRLPVCVTYAGVFRGLFLNTFIRKRYWIANVSKHVCAFRFRNGELSRSRNRYRAVHERIKTVHNVNCPSL